ncbi:MAG: SO_0444 family Cu/Zn efflux transporter [Verrucomicrobia bacterium]|nr:SO_0444 family Cu/Zn efflux transporter [Verrucomicrobiota bacterium]MBT7702570.1 SO_0444 family Cu/Zn efflux transporter [Verrucomicrobiota bacterium]
MDYILTIAHEFWLTLEAMAPYLLFGFAVAGLLSVIISPATVERQLGGNRAGSVFRAALFGVPLPLCSCSVIPVTMSLRRHGAGRGAATAFLLSTPQTGVDSIMVTYALLGPVMAVFRPIAAFITGVIGGLAANALHRGDAPPEQEHPRCQEACCVKGAGTPKSRLARALQHGFITLPKDIGKPMLAGILIAGVIACMVPESLFAEHLGGGLLSMLAMMLLGIPVYVCATASVPIAAVLIAKGVSPGAAMVFLMTGPATNAASIAAVWKVMGRGTASVYLATTATTALASGLLLDHVLRITNTTIDCHASDALPAWLRSALAVVLILVLVTPTLFQHRKTVGCCSSHEPDS